MATRSVTSSGLFLATIYSQSHVARYWLINTVATADWSLSSAFAKNIYIEGSLYGGSILPAVYYPCGWCHNDVTC